MAGNPQTHERILAAGLSVMRSQGLSGATTKEIAAAAGLSEAALYKHFPDKVALLTAVVVANLPRLDGTLASAAPLPLEDGIRDVTLASLAYLIDLGPVFTSIQADPELTRKVLRAVRAVGSEPAMFHSRLAIWFKDHAEMAEAPPEFAHVLAFILFGSCNQFATMSRLSEPGEMPPADAFSRFLAAGLADMIRGACATTTATKSKAKKSRRPST